MMTTIEESNLMLDRLMSELIKGGGGGSGLSEGEYENLIEKDYEKYNTTSTISALEDVRGDGGGQRIFAGDKFEIQMARRDAATGSLDATVYQKTYDFYAGVATSAFFGFMPAVRLLSLKSITNSKGFLFGSITMKTPFNIPVQRFGNMSTKTVDAWGLRIGTGAFQNRMFAAIKYKWNPLTQYTTGVIPRGTSFEFGIIGPQGLNHLGGSLQFQVFSPNVIHQSSKLIKRY